MGDAEFSVDVILHTVVVAIKMVRSDVHQYGDVRTEVIHIIQLERAKFDNIIVMVIFGYLQSKTLPMLPAKPTFRPALLKMW